MARIAVIGEPLRINGYGLAGATLVEACDEAEAVTAWRELPDDVAVAVLTPAAARWLASDIASRSRALVVVLPSEALEAPGVVPS
jgi:vacuolar-type H+-ATPase subunit F/Vma7